MEIWRILCGKIFVKILLQMNHLFRWWLVAWSAQAIIWTNDAFVDSISTLSTVLLGLNVLNHGLMDTAPGSSKMLYIWHWCHKYRKTSSISRTKSQNLNVSCILLKLSSLNPLKTCVKLRMKM